MFVGFIDAHKIILSLPYDDITGVNLRTVVFRTSQTNVFYYLTEAESPFKYNKGSKTYDIARLVENMEVYEIIAAFPDIDIRATTLRDMFTCITSDSNADKPLNKIVFDDMEDHLMPFLEAEEEKDTEMSALIPTSTVVTAKSYFSQEMPKWMYVTISWEVQFIFSLCSYVTDIEDQMLETDKNMFGVCLYNISEDMDIVAEVHEWIKSYMPVFEDKFDNTDHLPYSWFELESLIRSYDLERYNMMKDEFLIQQVTNDASNLTDYVVCKLFYEMFKLEYVCSDRKRKTIYVFRHHKWTKVKNPEVIKTALRSTFQMRLFRLMTNARSRGLSSEMFEEAIDNICEDLQKHKYREKMYNAVVDIICSENFHLETDKHPHLFRCKNGIYDLREDMLRDGRPNDYITMGSEISYKPYLLSSPELEELVDLLGKVFVIPELLTYFIRLMSSCLEAGNKHKMMSIWQGLGDNAKSVIVRIITAVFSKGPFGYAVVLPTSALTGKRGDSGAASPEMAMLEGKLIAFVQEPNEDEKMNTGRMKEMIGNDALYIRALYSDPKNIDLRCTFVFISNRYTGINTSDKATWNRIRVLPFLSTFKDEEDITEDDDPEFTFIKDPKYLYDCEYLALPMLYLMTEEYKVYKKEGLYEPEIIKLATQAFRDENDIIGNFISTMLMESEHSMIGVNLIYTAYKIWLAEFYPKNKPENRQVFTQELIRRGLKPTPANQIIGICIYG